MKDDLSQLSISGGQAVVESLKIEEVECAFGLIGSAAMEIFDALYDASNIKFVGVRDERTGTHMADGYARASGKAGIIIAGQNGPGVTNLVTGIAQASKAFSPVISLAGDISSEHAGKDSFQEIDQYKLLDSITKKTFTAYETNNIPKLLSNAFDIALSPRFGPVHINFPRDILSNNCNFKTFTKHKEIIKNSSTIDEMPRIVEILTNSLKPVIVAGGGIKSANANEDLINLAKTINAPIVTSAGHGDAIPSKEELYAGQMGPRGNIIATKLLKESDVILALGTRLGFNSTFYSYENINRDASIIQIDIDPESLGRYFPVVVGICTDVKKFLLELNNSLSKIKKVSEINEWTENLKKNRREYLKLRDQNADLSSCPIQPTGLFKILREALPPKTCVTLDAGTLCLQATDMLNYSQSPSLFTPLDFGLVGFSFACGLGVKLAKPDLPVISLMGDGGFGMTISELSTAVQYNINTVTLVMNNNSWGAEKAYQRDFYKKRYIGSDIINPPFHKIAELYGGVGLHVQKISDLKEAINVAFKSNKPAVINVEIDPSAIYSFRKDSFQHKITN